MQSELQFALGALSSSRFPVPPLASSDAGGFFFTKLASFQEIVFHGSKLISSFYAITIFSEESPARRFRFLF